MQHDIGQLYEMNIHALRNIAREVGVKSPTTLKKKELIDEILQMESGNQQPCIPTKKGRPPKSNGANQRFEIEKIVNETVMELKSNTKKEFIACILKEIEKKLTALL
ncbi:MAG: Rho termination factor N-terminal domain-containing protein [Clostridia bacterium]|nr:Rho termination factor N-terminal domain-containing protein [Clostridia bacterium]